MSPDQLRFSRTHEWVGVEETAGVGTTAVVGLTDFALKMLTDLVFIELPPVGSRVAAGQPLGEVESVKAVSDLYSPVTGEVLELNTEAVQHLDRLADDPFGAGWLLKIRMADPAELAPLMDYAAYQQQCADEAIH